MIVVFFTFYTVGCNDVITQKDTEIVSDEPLAEKSINPNFGSWGFIREDGEYIYVCNENSVVRFKQDLTEKEVIYYCKDIQKEYNLTLPEGVDGWWFLDSFFLSDAVYIRLRDTIIPTHSARIIRVDLTDGTLNPDYKEEENEQYLFGMPVKHGDSIYYYKWIKPELTDNLVVRKDKSTNYENEVEILQNIRGWGYGGDGYIYYSKFSEYDTMNRCDTNGNNVESGDHVKKAFEGLLGKKRTVWQEKSDLAKSLLELVPEIDGLTNPYFTQEYVYYQRIIYDEQRDIVEYGRKIERIEIYRQNLDSGVFEQLNL
jgi:hypothetical protein